MLSVFLTTGGFSPVNRRGHPLRDSPRPKRGRRRVGPAAGANAEAGPVARRSQAWRTDRPSAAAERRSVAAEALVGSAPARNDKAIVELAYASEPAMRAPT